MDFFTQTIDASLWTSRTYEDPEYDGDSVSATSSRLAFTFKGEIGTAKQLIIACGADAIRAVKASVILPKIGLFESGKFTVPVHGNHEVAVVYADVPASHSVQLADELFSVLQPTKCVVLTAVARWSLRGRPEPGVFWLRATSPNSTSDALRAPSFLTGIAAALLTEAVLTKRELSVATLVKDDSVTCYDDILMLRKVMLKEMCNETWIATTEAFEEEVRQQLKVERASSSAMYM